MSRTTYQKQCVLKILQAMRGRHPTVEEVYEEVSKTIPSISLATVYRILNQNTEQGMIARVRVPGSAVRYDDFLSPHHHLLCNACNRLFDLPPLHLAEIPVPQGVVSGHTITGVDLVFRGICSGCAAKKAEKD